MSRIAAHTCSAGASISISLRMEAIAPPSACSSGHAPEPYFLFSCKLDCRFAADQHLRVTLL